MPETRRPVLARRGEPECQESREHDEPGASMLLCWLPEGHDGEHYDTYDGWWPNA